MDVLGGFDSQPPTLAIYIYDGGYRMSWLKSVEDGWEITNSVAIKETTLFRMIKRAIKHEHEARRLYDDEDTEQQAPASD